MNNFSSSLIHLFLHCGSIETDVETETTWRCTCIWNGATSTSERRPTVRCAPSAAAGDTCAFTAPSTRWSSPSKRRPNPAMPSRQRPSRGNGACWTAWQPQLPSPTAVSRALSDLYDAVNLYSLYLLYLMFNLITLCIQALVKSG